MTNSITRVYGTLAITKIVQALGGVNRAKTTFSGTWSGQYSNNAPPTGTWTRTGAGAATLSGPTDQLLIGSVCTVTETDKSPNQPNPNDSSYVWGPETVTGPVTLTVAAPNGSTAWPAAANAATPFPPSAVKPCPVLACAAPVRKNAKAAATKTCATYCWAQPQWQHWRRWLERLPTNRPKCA